MDLRLIADIGGTNARFAIARNGTYDRLIHVEVARYKSLRDALLDYLNDLPPAMWPSQAAIAVAGPVLGDRIALTNLSWSFSISELKQSLGLNDFKVFNDFVATAMAVPYLPSADVFPDRSDQCRCERADWHYRAWHRARRQFACAA